MAISNPFADLKDAPYSNFDVARANAALGEDSDEGGGGMDSLRRMHTMAVWLGDQYDRDLKQGVFEDPDGITEFNVDEILQSTYLDPNTDQPVRWSSADVLSKLTGIPKRSLPELLGIAGIETGPRAAAAALGTRAALTAGAPAIMKVPSVPGKLLTGFGLGIAGAVAGATALEESNKAVERFTGFGLPEKPPIHPVDLPFETGAETAIEFGLFSQVLRGAARKLPDEVDLGAGNRLARDRRQQQLFDNKRVDPLIGAIPLRPSRIPGQAGRYVERSLGQYGRLARGDIPGYWLQEGSMALGAGLGSGVAEAVDPGDPLSQFMGMLLGPLAPLGIASRLAQRTVRPFRSRYAAAEGDTFLEKTRNAAKVAAAETGALGRIRAEQEASRQVDQWIELVDTGLQGKARAEAEALRTTYASRVAEIPEALPAAERDAAIEAIQKDLSESSRTPLHVLKKVLFEEGSSYVPITRQSIADAVLNYRTVLEEKFPGMPLDEILKLQLPGQIGAGTDAPERMPLSLVVEALTQKDLAVSRRAVQGRPLEERTGEAMALEAGQAMDEQESLLASHLQNLLLTAGGDYNIQLATLLSRAIFEDGIEKTYLSEVLSNVELVDRYLQPKTAEAVPKNLEVSRISEGRGAFSYLPAEKANEFLYKSTQDLYGDLVNESTGPVSALARQLNNNQTITLDNFLEIFGRLKQEIGLYHHDVVGEEGKIQNYSGSRGDVLAVLEALRKTGSTAPEIVRSSGARPPPQLTPLLDLRDKYVPLIQEAKENILRSLVEEGGDPSDIEKYRSLAVEDTKEQLSRSLLTELLKLPREAGAELPRGLGDLTPELETALLSSPIRDELRIMRDSLFTGGQLTGGRSPDWFREMQTIQGGRYKSNIKKTRGTIDKLLEPTNQPLGEREARVSRHLIDTAAKNFTAGYQLPLAITRQIEGYTGRSEVSLSSLIEWDRRGPDQMSPTSPMFLFQNLLPDLLKELEALRKKGLVISPRQALAMFDEADTVKRGLVEAGPVSPVIERGEGALLYDPVGPSPVKVGDVRTLIRTLGEISKDLSRPAAKIAGLWRQGLRADLRELASGQKLNPETMEQYPPDPALLNFNAYVESVENIFSRSPTGRKRSQLSDLPPPAYLLDPKNQQAAPTAKYLAEIFELGAMLQEAKMPSLLGGEGALQGLRGEQREALLGGILGPEGVLLEAGQLEGVSLEAKSAAWELASKWEPQITSFAEVVDDLFRGAVANDVFEVMNEEGVRIPLRDLLSKDVILPKIEGGFLAEADQLANALEREVFPGVNETPFNVIRVNQRKLAAYADNLRELILNQTSARDNPDGAIMAPEILNKVEGVLADLENIQTRAAMIEALTNSDSGWARAVADEKSLDALYAVESTQDALGVAIKSRSPQERLMTYIRPLQRLKDSDLTFTDTRSNMEVRGRDLYPQLRDGFYNDIISIALEESGLFRRPGERGADLEAVPYRDRRRKPGFHPAQFIKDFLFNTSNAKTPTNKTSPYARRWPKDKPPLFDFLEEHGMLPEGEPAQLRKQIGQFLDSLIELDEIFRGIREGSDAPNLMLALEGLSPDKPQTVFGGKLRTRLSGLVGAGAISNIWNKIGQIFPLLGRSGGVAIPQIGASMGRDVLGQTPKSFALPFVQNLFRPGRQEELAAFLASPSGPSESILQRMLAELTGGSPHMLTAIQAYVNSEDPLEEERGWPERLGLSEEGALGSMLPPPPPPPPPTEPVPTAQVQAPPAQPMASLQPSPASPAVRSQYAAAFPFDAASDVIRQQQAKAPAQQGIGSLV